MFLFLFSLPASDFILDILYLLTQKFYSIHLFLLCLSFIIFPLCAFVNELCALKAFPASYHSSFFYQSRTKLLWLSQINGSPAVYGERLTGFYVFETHDNVPKFIIYIIVWTILFLIQVICAIPVFVSHVLLVIVYTPWIICGYILYQTKLMSINYIWNKWIAISCSSDDAKRLFREESPDVINLEFFNKSVVVEILMETVPQIFLQMTNNMLLN